MIRTKFLIAALLLSTQAFAAVNTLDLVDEYRDGSAKVCVYSNGHRTEVITKDGAGSCPSKKTFH